MPLNPISVSKSADNSSNRLAPGKVVEYEQHSKPILAVTLAEKKGKWAVLNQFGGELELPVTRLYLLPGELPNSVSNSEGKIEFLQSLTTRVSKTEQGINLEEVWQVMLGEVKETSVDEVTEFLFSKNDAENHLAVRRALVSDQIYFKRKKHGFEPRAENIVDELKVKVRVEMEKAKERERFVSAIIERLNDPTAPIPNGIKSFEQLAALGKSASDAKKTAELLEEIIVKSKLTINGKIENRAFQLLVAMGHFDADENLTPIRLGRPTNFSAEVIEQAAELASQEKLFSLGTRRDLRDVVTITIDGAETRDFDDALSLEKTDSGFRIGVHISDVASVIPVGSLLEDECIRRATSVYCPDSQIPMLPHQISEDALSLVEGTERGALSFIIEFDDQYNISSRHIYKSLISINRRFSYEEADGVLCSDESSDPLSEMLLALWEASSNSEARRRESGAVQFARREMSIKVLENKTLQLEENDDDTPARKLVSEMMILANETAALFARDNGIPLVFRSQDPPDVDISEEGHHLPDGPAREYFVRGLLKRSTVRHDPAPHYGLGIEAYTQVTSPIRRVIDLINQRQLEVFIDRGEILYPPLTISDMLAQVESGISEAMQIQRERNRYWLLKYLIQEKIREIDAVIVRNDGLKPLAEIGVIYSLFPFHPKFKKNGSEIPKGWELGRSLKLKIESINPRTQTLILREIE